MLLRARFEGLVVQRRVPESLLLGIFFMHALLGESFFMFL